MSESLRIDLVLKATELQLKMIELQKRYKQTHPECDDKKVRKYINRKLRRETEELVRLNIEPVLQFRDS